MIIWTLYKFMCALSGFRVLLEERKATVPCLAERLTTELIWHINKSLPLLENQLKESHQRATEELRQCGDNIPSSEADKMFFLIEKIKVFNQDIEKLIEGEEIVKEKESRLYNKIREEFKSWILVLAANTQKVKNIIHEEVSKYDKQYRGKELLGFVSYKTFETIMKQYLEQLVDPALEILQKAVEIIWQTFTDTAQKSFGGFYNLNHTVQETSKRLANQIPFIIQYFMLQENGDYLQKAMMQILQEKQHYTWLLQEQGDTTAKRKSLQEKIYRLVQARRALYEFPHLKG
ncbi:Interferon-induced GTP-binding protein Mx2, partial [Eschrichtius robustus]|nr:Interferon-induced GTP-binding protein Mx2 [Eschrichtius robustus]